MKVSIVIPCRNEVKQIEECLTAIYGNTLLESEEVEVLVVDGMSDDGTRELLESIKPKFRNLQIVDNVQQVTPIAFNLGVKAAKGDFIQIIGARQIISKNYLQEAVSLLESKSEVWCVGGRVNNHFTDVTSRIIGKAMDTPFGIGGGNFRIKEDSGYVDTIGTPMYPKFVFDKIGYFDEELVRNQDDDFNYRVTNAGGKIYHLHTISLDYFVRAKYAGLKRQYFQYGYWKVYVNKKHKSVTTIRQLFPPALVLFALASVPLALIHCYILITILGIWCMYFILAKYFALKKASNFQEYLGIIRSFLILHFQYGAGYLKGVFHFLILRKKPSKKEQKLSR